jgi:hypothetical protein
MAALNPPSAQRDKRKQLLASLRYLLALAANRHIGAAEQMHDRSVGMRGVIAESVKLPSTHTIPPAASQLESYPVTVTRCHYQGGVEGRA